MDLGNHLVSGIYTSRAEADVVRMRLIERGMPDEQMHIVDRAPDYANAKMADDDEALKDVLVDGSVGAAAGAGIGLLAEVALVAANVTLFVASPLIAPLAMLGWGASLGGIVGAAVGAVKTAAKKEGKFSDLVLDAIKEGHVVLVAITRTEAEKALASEIIGDSVLTPA